MRVHFFPVISSTCATYFWSKMAAPGAVITSAFQLVGQTYTSIWKWHITSTQIPLAKLSSMFMDNLGVVGTQKVRGMWSYFRTVMRSNKGHHPSFISLYSFLCGSPHRALGLFWPADMELDEVNREHMIQAVPIWGKQERKEDKKV